MLGHKWESFEGTIVDVQTSPGHGHGMTAALHPEHTYVIEVRKPTGELIRGTVTEKSMFAHAVGQQVRVEVHSKNNEFRLDPSTRTVSIRGTVNMADQIRSAADGMAAGGMTAGGMAAGGTVGGAAGLAGLLGALGAAQGGQITSSVHVVNASGQEIHLDAGQGAEISGLAQAMLSGDPAARQAAIERLRQIKAQAAGQAAAQTGTGDVGFSGPAAPTTFDPIGPASTAGTFGDPVQNSFGQPAAPGSYSQATPPDPYCQMNSPASFGAPSAFDPFSGGAGQGTVEDRMAKLQQLYDKGILTESEYQAKRQQIINGI